MQKPYPIYDKNGRKTIPFGATRTLYLVYNLYNGVPHKGGLESALEKPTARRVTVIFSLLR